MKNVLALLAALLTGAVCADSFTYKGQISSPEKVDLGWSLTLDELATMSYTATFWDGEDEEARTLVSVVAQNVQKAGSTVSFKFVVGANERGVNLSIGENGLVNAVAFPAIESLVAEITAAKLALTKESAAAEGTLTSDANIESQWISLGWPSTIDCETLANSYTFTSGGVTATGVWTQYGSVYMSFGNTNIMLMTRQSAWSAVVNGSGSINGITATPKGAESSKVVTTWNYASIEDAERAAAAMQEEDPTIDIKVEVLKVSTSTEVKTLLETDFTTATSLPEGWTATHASRADVSYDSTKGAYVTNWNKNTLYTSIETNPKMKTSIHVETYANNNADINAVIALSSGSYSVVIGNSYSNYPKIQIGSFAESVNDTYISYKSADGKAPANPTEVATSTEVTVSKPLTYDIEIFGTALTGTVSDGEHEAKAFSFDLPAGTAFSHIGFSLDGANGNVGIKKVVVSETAPHTFKVGLEGDEAGKFWLDGKEFLIRCGEMHYGRIPRAYWRDRIRKTKAMGFNAVCAYMFWNNHEPVPGHFRFDGEQDVREFCKIAQEEGMWVVLRPGPYTCAEWEFGGYPWWLLSSKMSEDGTINIRTKDADYRQYTDRYMQKVGEQLADMQITRGGNIIMIQVENEYGTYGNDAEYMKMEYDAIVNAGFDGIQKFTCNPTFNNGVTNARIPELFYVVNGSGGFFDGENRMQKLIDARLPGWENAPQMIGEYYTAWYDSWGGTHQTKSAQAIVNDFATFIERGVSFSVYMVYGGTSFGYWGGFNTPFVPMTTSYDYDSPINETGKLTDKFYAIKELFDQNMNEGETAVPAEDVPSWVGVQTGTIAAKPTYASLWNAPSYTKEITEPTDAPLTFENADLGYGYAIYETTLAAGQGGKLMADCRDLGVVRVDGEFVGYLDRRTTWGWVEIEPADHPRKLEILVEALGRNHYAAFNDASKGLRGKPTLDKVQLSNWTMKTFNFLKWDEEKGEYTSEMDNLVFAVDANPSARSGSFYKYNVTLDPTKDALLDMRAWRRGMVCVNGIWVGRYWTIGPQQTLYIPGCWLKAGENANEIIILDTVGVEPQNELTFSETHIISENRSDLDYYTPPELPEQPKSLEALWGDAVKTGNLANNRSLQTVTFDAPATGRYFAFKATSAHSGQYAACAEFNLLDAAGQTLDRTNWTIVSCSSQEQRGEDAQIEKLLDGNTSTIWHSEWKVVQSTLPQYFVIDLGAETTVSGFTWLGRQSGDAGFVNAYSVYMMNENPAIDPETGVTIASGTLEAPFTIASAADLNNVKVTLKSGAVMKVMSSANCKLTITGEGKDSILILDGAGDYGLNAGSKLENLTILIDTENAARKIWLETRDPAVYDKTTHLVVKSGSAVISGGGAGVTFGTLTLDGGTLDIRNSTPITVTDTLYLQEGATKPNGVTLAEGAKVETIGPEVPEELVWDNTKEDWTDTTQAYDGDTLVAISSDQTIIFRDYTGVLYDKRSNKTALKLKVESGNLTIGHDAQLDNLPSGTVVTIAEGCEVHLRCWNTSGNTVHLPNVTFDGPGKVVIDSVISTADLGTITGTAPINLGTATITFRTGGSIAQPISGAATIPYVTGLQYASDWTGTVKAGAVDNGGASLNVNRYGIEGSKVEFDSLTNFWFPNDGRTVNPTLVLKGEMLVDDMSAQHYVLKHVTSTAEGSLVIGKKKNINPASFTITKMSDFAGTLKNTTATTLTISTLVTSLTEVPTAEIKVVSLIDTAIDKLAVTNVALADGTDITDQVKVSIKADGIYVEPNAVPFASKVVRAHPRLTRGLPMESLIGLRFTAGTAAKLGDGAVKFAFTNCSASDLSELKLWKMNDPEHAYAFAENAATMIAEATISGDTATFSPKNVTVQEGDVLWVTAKIKPDISADAEIRTAIGEDADMTEVKPHKIFPHYYRSGAYFRADRVTGNTCAPLEDATDERLKSLNDLIIINDLEPFYDEASDSFSTTWDKRRDNSDGVAYVKKLRDTYHPQAMVRLGLTKNDTKMAKDGEIAHPLAFAVSTPKYRQQLIAAIVSVMEATGVDGLDVDWEYPGVNSGTFTTVATWERDWHNYGLFLRDLAEVFFDRGWVLSMCTNLGWTMPSDLVTPELKNVDKTKFHSVLHVADYIDSMAYGDATLNASPMVMQKAIKVITDCGVPERRIVVGKAMYAYEVQNPGWSAVVGWLAEAYPESRTRQWDADLVWKHREATKTDGTVVSTEKETFEGPSSYHAKIAWCREHEMGGAMSWGYYTDVAWNRADLMSLGRHHAKALPMIANLPSAPALVDGIYQIATEADWNWLSKNGGVRAKLTADITFTYDPMMIGEWTGTLDGNNRTLTIPADVWIAREGSTGLFGTILNGKVKNLKIVLNGRVLTRASRWNDTTVAKGSTASTCPENVYVGVLAAEIRASSKIENVTIELGAGAEVQGVYRTGVLAGNVYAPNGATLNIKNCKVVANGVVHNININSSETVLPAIKDSKVDALVGHVQQPTGATTVVFSQTFALDKEGRVSFVDAQGAVASKSQEAYLLGCEDSEVVEKAKEFKFTAEDLEKLMKGDKLETINGVEFNGKLTILGAKTLDGEWSENLDDAKFFKAQLTL